MLLYLLVVACFLSSCWGATIPILRDMSNDWTTVVSAGHLIEAFSSMGQLHLLASDASTSEKANDYNINLHSYSVLSGQSLEMFSIQMEYVGYEGHIRWYNDSATWKIKMNDCTEEDFSVAPTASDDDTYHWILLLHDERFFLKCNNVVVAMIENDDCYLKIGIGKFGIGGWELINMAGLKTRFEDIKNADSCTFPSHVYKRSGGLIAVKKLTTAEDCRYDCKYTEMCNKVTISLSENACRLYSKFAGRPRYDNQQGTESDETRYHNYVFGDKISIEMECFDYTDDPCWRKDVRFEIGAEPTLLVKSMETCLLETYSNPKTVMWNPIIGKCSTVHDEFKMINEIPAPGFLIVYSMCLEKQAETTYDGCYEYGVILEGKVLDEIAYKLPFDCRDACDLLSECSGWSGITESKKCYLYTGAVYKVSFPPAISGTYNCLTNLAPIPQDPKKLVQPVARQFDLLTVTEPGSLNMFLLDNDVMRTVHVYENDSYIFKFDFFPRRQYSEFDLRVEGCAAAFNYTTQPCAEHLTRSRNYYQVELNLEGSDLTFDMTCGEGEEEETSFITLTPEVLSSCSIEMEHWNGLMFENFSPSDEYNFGLTADYPTRTDYTNTPTFGPSTLSEAPDHDSDLNDDAIEE